MEENWIDIGDIATKLQPRAESLLKDWFPNGKRLGNEFLVGSLNGEAGQSLRINLETGKWMDFASPSDKGGDLVSLYAAIKEITNPEAARILADEFSLRAKTEKIKKNGNGHTNGNGGSNVVGIYDPFHDRTWGSPTEKYIYYKGGSPYFHVCRYEKITDDGKKLKSFKQLTLRPDGVWVIGLKASGITAPYPLFADKIETDTVLIVEGEKTCVAARKISPFDVVTWFGGTKNVLRSDWSPVYGKNIIIWPDNDGPGHEASHQLKTILKEHCNSIRVVDTSKFEQKFDAFDFVQAKKLWNEITFTKHEELELSLNSRGDPYVNERNVHVALSKLDIWYDEFRQKRMIDKRPIRDEDYHDILFYFQNDLQMHKMTANITIGGVKLRANKDRRNPVKEYFESLKWDGEKRIQYYMSDVYGSPKTSYVMEVSKNFFIAMVARVLNPGCKFDHMIVLEGKQGLGKSTSLKELAGEEFYWDCSESMESKDFVRGLKGKMIVELSELNSVLRSNIDMVKKTLSCQVDEYVEKYKTENVVIPRTCVLVGTTNEMEYLSDSTGNRRFWPVKVEKQVDLDFIRKNREQLFAEAVYRHKNGETYWEFKEEEAKKEAREQQETRLIDDEWMEPIAEALILTSETTVNHVLEKLKFPLERATIREQRRIGKCLTLLGFKKIQKRDAFGKVRKLWVKE